MKRLLTSVLLGAACMVAHAQTPAFQTVQDSFNSLRGNNSVWLKMDARQEVGAKAYNYTINLYWLRTLNASGDTIFKLESSAYDSTGMVRRLVGDGNTFWVYDVAANTYSTEIYWPEGAKQPSNYQVRLMEAFSRTTRGSESFLARMIQEIYAGPQATYRPWVIAPTANSMLIPEKSSAPDPMNPSEPKDDYHTAPGEEIALFWAARPSQNAHRVVAFFFDIDGSGNRNLRTIEYRDVLSNSPWRFNSFKIDVFPGVTPAAANFQFVPPTNARAIVNTRPGIG